MSMFGGVRPIPRAPVVDPLEPFNVRTAAQLAEPLPPIPWVCEPLGLAPGAVSLIAGYGYSRKTMAMQALGLSVAMGRPVWGVWSCAQGPFVHLDYEQGGRLTQDRYQRLARGMGFELAEVPEGMLRACVLPRVYLDGTDPELLCRLCDGARFVLVDSLRAAFPNMDENSSEARAYLDILSRVSERTGAAFSLIHHARKPNATNGGSETHAIRGSSALFDACQSVWVFQGEKGQPTTVNHRKDRIRGAELEDFGLTSDDVQGPNGEPRWGLVVRHLEAEQMEADAKSKRAAAQEASNERATESLAAVFRAHECVLRMTRSAVKGLSGMGTKPFDAAWAKLIADGRLIREGKSNQFVWRLLR